MLARATPPAIRYRLHVLLVIMLLVDITLPIMPWLRWLLAIGCYVDDTLRH